jgi:hypothetical protein
MAGWENARSRQNENMGNHLFKNGMNFSNINHPLHHIPKKRLAPELVEIRGGAEMYPLGELYKELSIKCKEKAKEKSSLKKTL